MIVSQFPEKKIQRILDAVEEIKEMGVTDPKEIAKIYDVEISNTHIKTTPAFFNRHRLTGKTTIYIDTNTNEYAQNILCLHELGHILCDDFETDLFDHKVDPVSEFTANAFMILIMGDALRHLQGCLITGDTKIENINNYINMQVEINRKDSINGQYSIFDSIDINDEFWSMI